MYSGGFPVATMEKTNWLSHFCQASGLALLMEFTCRSKTHFDNSFVRSLAEARASFSELQV